MDNVIIFLKEIALFYNEVAIFLIFGFIVAAILHVFFPESLIRKHLGNDSFKSVFKATLFGIPIPICSCGVIPVATSLKHSGASKGATVSFLITTPQIGADSFLITFSLLGWVFGVFRIIASFVTGILAGIFVNLFGKNDDGTLLPMAADVAEDTMAHRAKNLAHYVEYELLGSIANSLILGFIIAGLITVLVPEGFFEMYMGSDFISMLVMLVIGIPMYVCASASTPIAASLIMKGLSPGAALVFLLTGPATNAIGIAAIAKVVGKKSTLIYLAVISVSALAFGYMMNLLVNQMGLSSMIMHHHTEMLPMWLKLLGSVVLTLMLVWYYVDVYLFKKFKIMNNTKGQIDMSHQITLNVSGMNCMHCQNSVKKAVENVQGTSNVSVDLSEKKVVFDIMEKTFVDKVKSAITFAGFTVENS
ncbi:MAG: permease [Desulfobacteraceae bacterium]|jgi:hypothetical protein